MYWKHACRLDWHGSLLEVSLCHLCVILSLHFSVIHVHIFVCILSHQFPCVSPQHRQENVDNACLALTVFLVVGTGSCMNLVLNSVLSQSQIPIIGTIDNNDIALAATTAGLPFLNFLFLILGTVPVFPLPKQAFSHAFMSSLWHHAFKCMIAHTVISGLTTKISLELHAI